MKLNLVILYFFIIKKIALYAFTGFPSSIPPLIPGWETPLPLSHGK
jgi:hypothetical protein